MLKAPVLNFTDTGLSVTDGITRTGLWSISTTSDIGWEYSLNQGATWIIGQGNSFEVTQDGAQTIWVRSRDNDGNVSDIVIAKCVLDTRPPSPVNAVLIEQTGVTRFDLSGFEQNASWEYSFDQGQSWRAGIGASLSVLGNAFPKLSLRQLDLAGNPSMPTELDLDKNGRGWREVSNDPLKPDSVGALDHTLLVHGEIVRNDADYFRVDIPADAKLQSAKFTVYQSADAIAFYAMQQQSVFSAGTDVSKMLAFGHFGPEDLDRNLLLSIPSTTVLTGPVTTWVNQTGSLITRYALQMDFAKSGAAGDTIVSSPMTLSINGIGTNSANSEIVMGQGSIDKFVYQAPSSAYSIGVMAGGLTVTSRNSSEVDRLTSVERIKFADKSIAFDVDGNAGKVYRIYKAAFGRDPTQGDLTGLGYWISQTDNGMSLLEVSARFIDSSEFTRVYGLNSSNSDFLSKLYRNILGRNPDQIGFGWWLDQLNTNPEKTRRKVLADFSESPENKQSVATLIGNGISYAEFLM